MKQNIKFSEWLRRTVNIFLLGCIWFLCSLPIFTIGASTCALNSCMKNEIHHLQQNIIKDYFSLFKKYFKTATLLWVIHLVAIIIAIFEFIYYQKRTGLIDTIGMVTMLTLTILISENAILCFICIPEITKASIRKTIKSAIEMGSASPLRAFSILLITCLIPLSAFLLEPALTPFSFGLASWLAWQIIPNILQKHQPAV